MVNSNLWRELDIACVSIKEWICFILDIVHILGGESIAVQTLCISGYRQFVLLDTERMRGYGYFVLLDVERITGYRQISCVYPVDPKLSSKLHYLTPFPRY